jgi:hypothetical protein
MQNQTQNPHCHSILFEVLERFNREVNSKNENNNVKNQKCKCPIFLSSVFKRDFVLFHCLLWPDVMNQIRIVSWDIARTNLPPPRIEKNEFGIYSDWNSVPLSKLELERKSLETIIALGLQMNIRLHVQAFLYSYKGRIVFWRLDRWFQFARSLFPICSDMTKMVSLRWVKVPSKQTTFTR